MAICSKCGSIAENGRFCGGCGTEIKDSGDHGSKEIRRPRTGRMVAGVCAGLAQRYGVPANVLRVLFIFPGLFFFSGPILYIILVLKLPDAEGRRYVKPSTSTNTPQNDTAAFNRELQARLKARAEATPNLNSLGRLEKLSVGTAIWKEERSKLQQEWEAKKAGTSPESAQPSAPKECARCATSLPPDAVLCWSCGSSELNCAVTQK